MKVLLPSIVMSIDEWVSQEKDQVLNRWWLDVETLALSVRCLSR